MSACSSGQDPRWRAVLEDLGNLGDRHAYIVAPPTDYDFGWHQVGAYKVRDIHHQPVYRPPQALLYTPVAAVAGGQQTGSSETPAASPVLEGNRLAQPGTDLDSICQAIHDDYKRVMGHTS